MTLESLTRKYTNLPADAERLEEQFLHMGKFGKMTCYGFSFETENAAISVEVYVKAGRITGFTPEKEPRVDEWSYSAAEEYSDSFTAEECSRIDRYLASVLA